MPPDAAAAHNELFRKALELCNPLIQIDPGAKWRVLNIEERRRLEEAISLLDAALRIFPKNWAAMWFKGKSFQRLDRHPEALREFELALEIVPDQPDVAREAGLEAIELGNGPKATTFCRTATALRPNDAGLRANLALAHLINQEVDDAMRAAFDSLKMDPADKVTDTLHRIILEVKNGKRPCPANGRAIRTGKAPS